VGPAQLGHRELETSPAAASLGQGLMASGGWRGVLGCGQGGRSPRGLVRDGQGPVSALSWGLTDNVRTKSTPSALLPGNGLWGHLI